MAETKKTIVIFGFILLVFYLTSFMTCDGDFCLANIGNGRVTEEGASRTLMQRAPETSATKHSFRANGAITPTKFNEIKSKPPRITTTTATTTTVSVLPQANIAKKKTQSVKTASNTKMDICQDKIFRSKNPLPLTALASFPGAGNTWARYVIEQTTGVYTGSVYSSLALKAVGFLGDGIQDGSVVAIKTHRLPTGLNAPDYKRCILLIRDPGDAMIAEFKRLKAGKVETPSLDLFRTPEWYRHVGEKTIQFEIFYRTWLSEMFSGEKYILRYEDLQAKLGDTMVSLVNVLLGTGARENLIACLEHDSEGEFHRDAADFTREDIFSSEQELMLSIVKKRVNSKIRDCVKRGPCVEIK